MKSCNKYIDKLIKSEFNRILKEQEENTEKTDDEVLDTFKNMDDFIKDEKEQSNVSVNNSLKLMSALTDPSKRNSENMNIKVQKERIKKLDTMKKGVEDQQKSFEDNLKKKQIQVKSQDTNTQNTNIGSQINSQTTSMTEENEKMSMPIIKRGFFQEQDSDFPDLQNPQNEMPIKKAYIVKFDTKTQEPFQVKFSERGFSIDNTRLSFEALENALSKNYTIVLNNGNGLALNAIRMQKILKYKDKWY